MILFLILLFGLFLSIVTQEFIGPLVWLHDARVMIMPIIMFYGALALPTWGMLGLAFAGGLMWDCITCQVLDNTVEISLGWSILLYAALGAIMSGFRPLFQRGRWEVHCLVSGVFTSLIVLAEFLMITIRRGGFVFTNEVWWRIAGSGIIAALLAPIFFFTLNWFSSMLGHQLNPEQKGLR
jgi:hypothetical protein